MNQESTSLLIKIINEALGVDITDKVRTKDVVLGRYIFARIMRDAGMGLKEIGELVNVHHATIIHYLKNFDGYMFSDERARTYYEAIYNGTPDDCKRVYNMNISELREENRKIIEHNNQLSLVIANLNAELKRLREEEHRLDPIIALIKKGVPRGKEEDAKIKFNQIINGLR